MRYGFKQIYVRIQLLQFIYQMKDKEGDVILAKLQ